MWSSDQLPTQGVFTWYRYEFHSGTSSSRFLLIALYLFTWYRGKSHTGTTRTGMSSSRFLLIALYLFTRYRWKISYQYNSYRCEILHVNTPLAELVYWVIQWIFIRWIALSIVWTTGARSLFSGGVVFVVFQEGGTLPASNIMTFPFRITRGEIFSFLENCVMMKSTFLEQKGFLVNIFISLHANLKINSF